MGAADQLVTEPYFPAAPRNAVASKLSPTADPSTPTVTSSTPPSTCMNVTPIRYGPSVCTAPPAVATLSFGNGRSPLNGTASVAVDSEPVFSSTTDKGKRYTRSSFVATYPPETARYARASSNAITSPALSAVNQPSVFSRGYCRYQSIPRMQSAPPGPKRPRVE